LNNRKEKKMRMIIKISGITVTMLGIAGFICLASGYWVPAIVCLGIFMVLVVVFGIGGLKAIHQEERAVVEFLGRFYEIKKPGLRWVCPIIMSIRAIVPIWEQTLILFKESIKIDFKDGSAVPKGIKAFIRIKDPGTSYKLEGETIGRAGIFRAIYYINNWRERAVELLENTVRSYLATLTIDEALPERRGGYDLLSENRMPEPEREKIRKTLEMWGLKLERITVTDFDLDPEIVKARNEVQKRKRAVEVAEHEKVVRATETVGSLIQMMAESTGKTPREIQKEIDKDPKLKKRLTSFSEELITRRMSIDAKALTDIRTGGGGNLEQSLLRLFAAFKVVPAAEQKGKKEKEKGDEKKKKRD